MYRKTAKFFSASLFLVLLNIGSAHANLIRADVTFEAINFNEIEFFGPLLGVDTPLDSVSGSFSFMIEDPDDHVDVFFQRDIIPLSAEIFFDGIAYDTTNADIKYYLYQRSIFDINFADQFVSPEQTNTAFPDLLSFSLVTGVPDFMYSIDVNGQRATFYSNDTTFNVTLHKVPEPTSLAFFALGLSILGFRKKSFSKF